MIFNELDRAIVRAAFEYGREGVIYLHTKALMASLGGDVEAIEVLIEQGANDAHMSYAD